jgi:hypothetical protein
MENHMGWPLTPAASQTSLAMPIPPQPPDCPKGKDCRTENPHDDGFKQLASNALAALIIAPASIGFGYSITRLFEELDKWLRSLAKRKTPAETLPVAETVKPAYAAVELDAATVDERIKLPAAVEVTASPTLFSEDSRPEDTVAPLLEATLRGSPEAMRDLEELLGVNSGKALKRELRRAFEAGDTERVLELFRKQRIFHEAAEYDELSRRERRGGF